MPGKISYKVFINTTNPSVPVLVGDPSASVQLGSLNGAPIFYIVVPGYYQAWADDPLPPTELSFSPWIAALGTIASTPTNFLNDAGTVVFLQGIPTTISIPNNYTAFGFQCVNPYNSTAFVPTGGVWINIEILEGPIASTQVFP